MTAILIGNKVVIQTVNNAVFHGDHIVAEAGGGVTPRPTITRLGLCGITRGLYGSFAGKSPSDGGRIMSSMVGSGGLAYRGGIAGQGGGLAG